MANRPQTIGNYRIETELGRGATSLVCLGRHMYLHERAVAIKLLLSHDDESIARFSREAELTSQLRHQHIVQIYDHATPPNNFAYTVMELVPGGSLRQRIEKSGRLPLKEAITIFKQIGSALDYAHGRQIIHRDVSPGNILLDSSGNRALLTDFGIARLPDQRHTSTDVIMGTPGFFSPEHARSATLVTSLSDLYGLGVILYFMLTGELPWDTPPAHPDYKFGAMILPSHRAGDLPPEMDKVVQTLLAEDPKKRYPSAGAALEAIDRVLVRAGIALDDKPIVVHEATAVRAINTAPNFQSVGLEDSEVEQVLAADLIRDQFEASHKRAEDLRDPLTIARILDEWSKAGQWREFRRPQLGRIVNLREVRSRNVYFYELKVLLETRSEPEALEEPDANGDDLPPVQREVPLWQVPLPTPTTFADDPGRTEIITGSERVIKCPDCDGSTYTLCPECKGSRRVLVTSPSARDDAGNGGVALHRDQRGSGALVTRDGQRPDGNGGAAVHQAQTAVAKQVLVPCTACNGMGRLKCNRCNGEGRLVQRRAFKWHRVAKTISSRDDLPNLDEDRIRNEVKVTTVYHEQQLGGTKHEWSAVPGLKRMIDAVKRDLPAGTKIAMSAVQIQMIPYTEVRLDMGHDDVVIEGESSERRANDQVHLVQLYGFENKLHVGSFAYDGQQKLLLFWSVLATVVVLLLAAALLAPVLL